VSEEIRAALTEQEWANKSHEIWANPPIVASAEDGALVFDMGDSMLCVRDEHRQQVAALALYGQPYGFTWEMADALAYAYSFIGSDMPTTRAAAAKAIDRIAALLPPRR
jgi:hypothetical protein